MRAICTLLILLLLAACSTEDDRQEPETASAASDESAAEAPVTEAGNEVAAEATGPLDEAALRALARDPEALREAMQDPERRQAIREQMRALREQRRAESGTDSEQRRAAMRERAQAFRNGREESVEGEGRARARVTARFWEDDATVEAIGLTEAQISSLGEAHQQLGSVSRDVRQSLARVISEMPEALSNVDRDQLQSLVEARQAAIAERARAEAQWMQTLLSTLSDEQLRQLAQSQPALVNRLVSPN
jgi:DNA polymerase I-like protein with 3'-5' exonuclease and polymerase domains